MIQPPVRKRLPAQKPSPRQNVIGSFMAGAPVLSMRVTKGPIVPLTAGEHAALVKSIGDYARKHGTTHGFVAEVMRV